MKLDCLIDDFIQSRYQRHIKTRGLYRVVRVGRDVDTEVNWVVYENCETGEVWLRRLSEFCDGRFEPVYVDGTPLRP